MPPGSARTPRVTGSNGSNGAGGSRPHDGGGDPQGDRELEEEFAVGEVPVEIHELAENCRKFALAAVGVELDYEPETLPVLDEYLRTASLAVRDRPELEPLITRAVAAYFGEVVRRRIDGFWRRREDPADPWELCGRRTLLSMSPLGMVAESLAKGGEHAGPSGELKLAPEDREIAQARLAVFPEVSEEEYYLLSTRLEVLEAVYEALRDHLRAEGRESLVFEEGDYEDE